MTVYKRKIVSFATVFVMLMACLFAMPQLTFAEFANAQGPVRGTTAATINNVYAQGSDITIKYDKPGRADGNVVFTSADGELKIPVADAKEITVLPGFENPLSVPDDGGKLTKETTVKITVDAKGAEIKGINLNISGFIMNGQKLNFVLDVLGGDVGKIEATNNATKATVNVLNGKVGEIDNANFEGTYFDAFVTTKTNVGNMKKLVKVKVDLAGGSIEGYEEDTYIGNMAVDTDQMVFVQDRDIYNKLMSAKGKDGAEIDKYTAKTVNNHVFADEEFSLVKAVNPLTNAAGLSDAQAAGQDNGDLGFTQDKFVPKDKTGDKVNIDVVTLTANYKKLDYWRVYGDTRIDTAIETSDMILKGKKAHGFVVASANDYPDALSAAPLTYKNRQTSPVLLVNSASEAKVIKYIIKNLAAAGNVSIVGGEGVVSANFEKELKAAMKDAVSFSGDVVRYAGANRILTNTAVLDSKKVVDYLEGPAAYLIVCTANEYADALAASAAGAPIMLVGNTLTDDQIDYIRNLNPANKINVVIVGGTGAVSREVEYWFRDYIKTKNSTVEGVARAAGDNRFETARLVAEMFIAPTSFVVARGYDFPDALVAGPLARSMNTSVVLVENNVTKPARQLAVLKGINKLDPWKAYVMGGPTLVSDEAMKTILAK